MASLSRFRIAVCALTACGLIPAISLAQTGTKTRPTGVKPRTSQTTSQNDREVQPASGTEKTSRLPRPEPQEMHIEPLPRELETLLQEWERVSAKFEKLSGSHTRIEFNNVFAQETYAQGQFYYESPDKGRIDIEPFPLKEGQPAQRANPKNGQKFAIKAASAAKWICTGEEVLQINEVDKTVEAFPLPPDLRGKNIIHGPLPFLFGMKADEAKRRFELSFTDPEKNTNEIVRITAIPRQMMDHENFREAHIILDRRQFVPKAVKLIDPSGNVETVYMFREININQANLVPAIFRKDPFRPSLKSYKMIMPPPVTSEIDRQSGQIPDNFDSKSSNVRQVGNSSSSAGQSRVTPSRSASSSTSSSTSRPRSTKPTR